MHCSTNAVQHICSAANVQCNTVHCSAAHCPTGGSSPHSVTTYKHGEMTHSWQGCNTRRWCGRRCMAIIPQHLAWRQPTPWTPLAHLQTHPKLCEHLHFALLIIHTPILRHIAFMGGPPWALSNSISYIRDYNRKPISFPATPKVKTWTPHDTLLITPQCDICACLWSHWGWNAIIPLNQQT